jgi:hypothetical protein
VLSLLREILFQHVDEGVYTLALETGGVEAYARN